MSLQQAIDQGREDLQRALNDWGPNTIFAGFSGGGDSLVATHLLHELRDDVAALHINTGIGMKRTRQYVRDTCEEQGWDLEEYKAEENGYSYDRMVRGEAKGVPGGFPGPPMHYIYYRRLKQRQIEAAHREHKGKYGGKILLVTGIREDESEIRSGYANQKVQHESGVVWLNLIYSVSAAEKQKYISTRGLDTNPVSDVYGMSGECLCGAFDEDGGRLCELKHACQKFGEPETYQRIIDLQQEVKGRFPWRWDQRRPNWYDRAKNGQLAIEGLPGADEANRVAQRMCAGCGKSASQSVPDMSQNKVTWLDLLIPVMKDLGDSFPEDVEDCTVALSTLKNEEFVQDHHGPRAPSFKLWTKEYVYYSEEYDGLPQINRQPRNPDNHAFSVKAKD